MLFHDNLSMWAFLVRCGPSPHPPWANLIGGQVQRHIPEIQSHQSRGWGGDQSRGIKKPETETLVFLSVPVTVSVHSRYMAVIFQMLFYPWDMLNNFWAQKWLSCWYRKYHKSIYVKDLYIQESPTWLKRITWITGIKWLWLVPSSCPPFRIFLLTMICRHSLSHLNCLVLH